VIEDGPARAENQRAGILSQRPRLMAVHESAAQA
jgi:hypothetical protein